MPSDFKTALKNRRTYYDITPACPVPDDAVRDIINYAVLNTPSAFNSQSARVVLLFGEQHGKLWDIIRETLRGMIPADTFKATDDKINSFAAGHGTVLFYEDKATVKKLQEQFPPYKDSFPWYSANSAGMLQLAVWTMLRDAGLGASLQHYGNLIQEKVAKTWNLDPQWLLIAQMPFGKPGSEPGPKESLPLETTVKVFS
jgi:predicted oxidoreductase (fatty acid repression mutant protein)